MPSDSRSTPMTIPCVFFSCFPAPRLQKRVPAAALPFRFGSVNLILWSLRTDPLRSLAPRLFGFVTSIVTNRECSNSVVDFQNSMNLEPLAGESHFWTAASCCSGVGWCCASRVRPGGSSRLSCFTSFIWRCVPDCRSTFLVALPTCWWFSDCFFLYYASHTQSVLLWANECCDCSRPLVPSTFPTDCWASVFLFSGGLTARIKWFSGRPHMPLRAALFSALEVWFFC